MEILQEWLHEFRTTVAQLMVGWAFVFLIEGACGFGTCRAGGADSGRARFLAVQGGLAVPDLQCDSDGLWRVGTPMWFGFELLELPQSELIDIGAKTALPQNCGSGHSRGFPAFRPRLARYSAEPWLHLSFDPFLRRPDAGRRIG
jgi:hypothetical protein